MNYKSSSIATLVILSSLSAKAILIDLTVNGGTSFQRAIVQQAATFWENTLTGYREDIIPSGVGVPPIMISSELSNIDGLGGTLASAGPTFVFDLEGAGLDPFTLTAAGEVNFDTSDIGILVANGSFLNVVVHEIGHVLGFGTLWQNNNLYIAGSGEYIGSEGLAAYQAEFDPTATFIPIELDGGTGTADGHFNESSNSLSDTDPGDNLPAPTVLSGPNTGESLNDEILTGFLSTNNFISSTTLGVFRDLGYTTTTNPVALPIQTESIPEPSTMLLSLVGLSALLSRRKRA